MPGRHREHPRLDPQHRCVAEQLGEPVRGHRGRGGQQPQVRTQPGARVEQQREQQIRVEMPLVTFVEQHRVHAVQLRVGHQPAQQQPGRHHLDAGAIRPARVATHCIADGLTDLFTEQHCHPGRGRPGGQSARFGDQHPAPVRIDRRRQGRRDQRRLPGARRRDQHRAAMRGQRVGDRAEHRTHRQVGQLGQVGAASTLSVPRSGAVPGSDVDARRRGSTGPTTGPAEPADAQVGRTQLVRIMQVAVPSLMLRTTLRRHRCTAPVTATPASSGRPRVGLVRSICARQ